MYSITSTGNTVDGYIKDMYGIICQLDHQEPTAYEELGSLLIEIKELQVKVWHIYGLTFSNQKESELRALNKLGCTLDRVASISLSSNNMNSSSKINSEKVNLITKNMNNINNFFEKSSVEEVSNFIASHIDIESILKLLNDIKKYLNRHAD